MRKWPRISSFAVDISDDHMFVLNEAKNEQKSSKNSKRHLENESEDEETDQKWLAFYFFFCIKFKIF